MESLDTILVTGGAGFIGSNFLYHLLDKDNNYGGKTLVVLDALTYAGDKKNINDLIQDRRIVFVEGNICRKDLVDQLFQTYDFDGVIHFAAESHVDNSIAASRAFIETNILGTHTLLEAARAAHKKKSFFRFLQVSTDEVYGQLGESGLFTHDSPIKPRSPYSASKASGDLLALAWHETYGLPVIVTRCSNNYGPRQHKEKLIPVVISKAVQGEPIPIYGTGKNIRDWIHVEDHCRGVALAYTKGEPGEVYCFGGDREMTNLELAQTICRVMDKSWPHPKGTMYGDQIRFVADRLGHDFRYGIDFSKAKKELGFVPKVDFMEGLTQTIAWYRNH
jgi:dTDP-glucose 4,6-dehydratase